MKFSIPSIITVAFLISFISGCVSKTEQSSPTEQLQKVIAAEHQLRIDTDPFYLPKAGAGNANSKLPDYSPQALASKNQRISALYQQLTAIEKQQLSASEQINYAVMAYNLKNEIDLYKYKDHYIPLTAEAGFHVYISFISSRINFTSEQDYQDYLARLAGLETLFEQQTYWLRQGLKEGISQPQVVMQGFEESILAFIKDDVTQSSYYKPFKSLPDFIPAEQQKSLQQQAQTIINDKVFPSYQKFYDFMVETYLPNARTDIAASSLPQGKQFYQNRVEHYTTLSMSADEVHQIGLNEVARIRSEMDTIIQSVEFKGSFADFVQFLRTDPQFYATTPEQLLKEASYIAKKMDAKLPSLFKTLPRTPYGVIAVPASIAPKYTTGRYSGPSSDTQPGNYWVNTYALDRRPLYVLEALTLHEAVPGHHLQGSISREMENVAEFRRKTYISAFGEGWGLYSEWLGIEAGFYQDPYSNFGRLTYEMWRACRLVVDTGMHIKGWSRDQAMQYLAENTALSLHNVKTEIDRYISWPGQALSYKIGELTIKKLRQKAQSQLGEHFDIREFHDEVLSAGSIPLSLLEQRINTYINKKSEQT